MEKSKYLWLLDAGHGGMQVAGSQLPVAGNYTTKPRKILREELERMGYRGYDVLWDTKSFIFSEPLAVVSSQLAVIGKQSGGTVPVTTVYEGVINRQIVNKLYKRLDELQIDCGLVHDDVEDTGLGARVQIADNVFHKYRNSIFVSIHSDKLSLSKVPYPTRHEDFVQANVAGGASVWTSKGQTKSDKIANVFAETGMRVIPHLKWRTDKRHGDYDQEADYYVLRKTDGPAILCETGFYDNRKEAEWLLSESGQAEYVEYLVQSVVACERLKPI